MADLSRLQVELSGTGVVGASVLTLYTQGAGGDLQAAAKTWIDAQKANITNDVTYVFPNTGDIIDEATGEMIGVWTGGTTGSVTGTSGASYLKGVGYSVRWDTAGIVAGRHVRGRSFIVPCSATTFNADGVLDAGVHLGLDTATSAFLTALTGEVSVWSRPTPARPGSAHAIVSHSFYTLPSWLKTRKT